MSSEKQIHVRLPFDLFSQLKVKCAGEAITIQDFTASLIAVSKSISSLISSPIKTKG